MTELAFVRQKSSMEKTVTMVCTSDCRVEASTEPYQNMRARKHQLGPGAW